MLYTYTSESSSSMLYLCISLLAIILDSLLIIKSAEFFQLSGNNRLKNSSACSTVSTILRKELQCCLNSFCPFALFHKLFSFLQYYQQTVDLIITSVSYKSIVKTKVCYFK